MKSKKYYINAAITVALMALVRFLPPFGSMTTLGMTVLGIFAGALYGWITCDMIWPSILALTMLGFTGYVANAAAAFTSAISNPSVQTILWLLVFSALLAVTGISKWLVSRLVNSRLCKGHPWRLSIVICLAVWLCASLGAGFAAILLCWQLVYSICDQVGYARQDKWPRMMICAIIFFNALGALLLPFQGGVVANYGFLANASNGAYTSYGYVQYLALSLTVSLVTTVVYMWCGQPMNDKVKLYHEYGDRLFIGAHSPFGPGVPVPEDDAELERRVAEFMEPYRDLAAERPFFVMDLRPTDRTRAAFYRYGRKLLTEAKAGK